MRLRLQASLYGWRISYHLNLFCYFSLQGRTSERLVPGYLHLLTELLCGLREMIFHPLCLRVLAPWLSYSWSPLWGFFPVRGDEHLYQWSYNFINLLFFFHNIGNITLSRMVVLQKGIKCEQSFLMVKLVGSFQNLFFSPAGIMV